jgi:CRISPR-associated endonuclease/helicase Cas3
MSLDLSADLLISDIASIPALIQRLGRLNRRSTPDNKLPPKRCIVRPIADDDALPYRKDEIALARRWLDELRKLDKALSQRDLANAFVTFDGIDEVDIHEAEERAWFFGVPGKSGLWRSRQGLTREEGYTVSVILESDLTSCMDITRRGEPKRDWIREHEVAIPFKQCVLGWERVGALRLAPGDEVHYDYNETTHEGTGASWITR